ncbi:unnamed protein product, partial [Oikopleura dioica]
YFFTRLLVLDFFCSASFMIAWMDSSDTSKSDDSLRPLFAFFKTDFFDAFSTTIFLFELDFFDVITRSRASAAADVLGSSNNSSNDGTSSSELSITTLVDRSSSSLKLMILWSFASIS